MKLLSLKRIIRVGAFLQIAMLLGCSNQPLSTVKEPFPVSWNAGFTLPSLLKESPGPVTNKVELSALLSAKWYTDITVNNRYNHSAVLSSCQEYANQTNTSPRPIKDSTINAYLEFVIMCEAAQQLLNAKPARISYLPDTLFTQKMPRHWPQDMAMQISTQAAERSSHHDNKMTWSDITPIKKVTIHSQNSASYFHDAGYQTLDLIGKGDINHDGIQDVLIVSRDHVEGGNYFNMRLLMLTITDNNQWSLISTIAL